MNFFGINQIQLWQGGRGVQKSVLLNRVAHLEEHLLQVEDAPPTRAAVQVGVDVGLDGPALLEAHGVHPLPAVGVRVRQGVVADEGATLLVGPRIVAEGQS